MATKKPGFISPMSKQNNHLKLLVHGRPGVGKTPFVATADDVAEMSPVLFVDSDRGLLSIRDRKFQVATVRSWQEIQELAQWLGDADHGFRTIVIDSLSEIYTIILRHAVNLRHKSQSRDSDPDVAERSDYRKALSMIVKFVDVFLNYNTHIIMTALSSFVTDSTTGIDVAKPMLAGQAADLATSKFDVIGYLYAAPRSKNDPGGVNLQIIASASVMARDRTLNLEEVMTDATIAHIYAAAGLKSAKPNNKNRR